MTQKYRISQWRNTAMSEYKMILYWPCSLKIMWQAQLTAQAEYQMARKMWQRDEKTYLVELDSE